jgi:hypothetical protein
MLHAICHRKISHHQRYRARDADYGGPVRAEDEITSTILGPLAMFPASMSIEFWRHLLATTPGLFPDDEPVRVDYRFWPRVDSSDPRRRSVEPDLLVTYGFARQERHTLLVELKRKAPLSSDRRLQGQRLECVSETDGHHSLHLFIAYTLTEAFAADPTGGTAANAPWRDNPGASSRVIPVTWSDVHKNHDRTQIDKHMPARENSMQTGNLVFQVKGNHAYACRIAGEDGKVKGPSFAHATIRSLIDACLHNEVPHGLNKRQTASLASAGILVSGNLVLDRIEVRQQDDGTKTVGPAAVKQLATCIILSNPQFTPRDGKMAVWVDDFIKSLVGSGNLSLNSIVRALLALPSLESTPLLLEVVRFLRKQGRINLAAQMLKDIQSNVIEPKRFQQRITLEKCWLDYVGQKPGARQAVRQLRALKDADPHSSNLLAYADIQNLIALFTERLDGAKLAQAAFDHALLAALRSGERSRILGAIVNRQVSLCQTAGIKPKERLIKLVNLMRLSDADHFPRDFYLARQIFSHARLGKLSLDDIAPPDFLKNLLVAVDRHQRRSGQPDIRRAELLAEISMHDISLHDRPEWRELCEHVSFERNLEMWPIPDMKFKRSNIADYENYSTVLKQISIPDAK